MDRRAIMGGAGVARLGVLGDLLRTAARDRPEAEAFRYRGERLTYRDWDTLADETAAALAARGIGRGDVVALLLPSTPFYLVGYLAAARLGAITTGINVRYRRTEIGHILGRSGAALVLAVERWQDAASAPRWRGCARRPACPRDRRSPRRARGIGRGDVVALLHRRGRETTTSPGVPRGHGRVPLVDDAERRPT